MDIVPLSYYNPLCTNCIKCTKCNISVEDTKKMHFIYNSVQNGYTVNCEQYSKNKYCFTKNKIKIDKDIIMKKDLKRSNSVP